MFSHISTFFTDLKISLKKSSMGTTSSSDGRRKGKDGAGGGYRRSSRADADDDEDMVPARGCLGRSVSMEWGLANARKRRTTSTESLNHASDNLRSASSLMELSTAASNSVTGCVLVRTLNYHFHEIRYFRR